MSERRTNRDNEDETWETGANNNQQEDDCDKNCCGCCSAILVVSGAVGMALSFIYITTSAGYFWLIMLSGFACSGIGICILCAICKKQKRKYTQGDGEATMPLQGGHAVQMMPVVSGTTPQGQTMQICNTQPVISGTVPPQYTRTVVNSSIPQRQTSNVPENVRNSSENTGQVLQLNVDTNNPVSIQCNVNIAEQVIRGSDRQNQSDTQRYEDPPPSYETVMLWEGSNNK